MKKLIYPFFICFIFINCGPKKLSFSESEIKILSKNSQIIENKINLFSERNYNSTISNEATLDSIIGKNNFNFLEKIDYFEIGSDNITYVLDFEEKTNILGLSTSTYNHKLIYSFESKANKTIDSNGEIVYLVKDGEINIHWADTWGVLEIVYWKKLDENLYYLIIEETFL